MKAISFSIFGYQDSYENSFSFASYLTGLEVNLRMTELIYPEWYVCLAIDESSYESKYREYFDYHRENKKLDVTVTKKGKMCEMMLRRMQPIFSKKYDRVICRDTDSLLSYRERQAVEYWIKGGRICHAITDSISHNIPLLGGMCGFMCNEFRSQTGMYDWNDMMRKNRGIDFSNKGSDQTFLNTIILPTISHSMTEHYCLGMPQSFRGDCHNTIQDIDIGLPDEFKETNALCFHIGASGYQVEATIKFLETFGQNNSYYDEIEKKFPEIFFWQLRK